MPHLDAFHGKRPLVEQGLCGKIGPLDKGVKKGVHFVPPL